MKLDNIFINRCNEKAYLSFQHKCDLYTLTVKPLSDCESVPNINHIWFLKQRIVRDLYNSVCTDSNLKELWVFGSATQIRCGVGSDLDIAYRYSGDVSNIYSKLVNADPNGVDCIDLDTVDEASSLYTQIRKGVRLI